MGVAVEGLVGSGSRNGLKEGHGQVPFCIRLKAETLSPPDQRKSYVGENGALKCLLGYGG